MSTYAEFLLDCRLPIIEECKDCVEIPSFQMNDVNTLSFLWGFGEEQPLNHFEFALDCDNESDISQLADLLAHDLNVGLFDDLPVHASGWTVIRPISSVDENFWVRTVHPDTDFLTTQSDKRTFVLRCCDSHARSLYFHEESGLWSISRIIPDLS